MTTYRALAALCVVSVLVSAAEAQTPIGHDDARILPAATVAPAQTVAVNVDAGANRHPIDPNIYGVAWVNSTAGLNTLGATLNRWGGNAMSRHNWIFSTTNRAKDYFFINIPDNLTGANPIAGGSADDFVAMTRAGVNGVEPVITIPMMSLLPKDRSKRCSYKVSLYGAQEATAPPPYEDTDCGNGKRPDHTRMKHINNTADTAAPYLLSHQTDWIQHLIDRWQPTPGGKVRYYSLDNEASLWSFDHWDIHPDGATTDEVWGKMRDFGAAIKAKDPGALTTGPEEWGWQGYFFSGLDQENNNNGVDRAAHEGLPYIEWLLKQAKLYDIANSKRILDVFTVHFYPQNGESLTSDVTSVMQGFRNRSTRSLWDPNYTDESWMKDVEGGKIDLIPRLKQMVANQYPGTKIGITEYNWGAENDINGATAQADVLGIFGREGLDMAIRWTSPVPPSFTSSAFQMYRNYDGAQSRFGDISVSASGPNPDEVAVFSALRSSNNTLTVMLISKTAGDKPATVNLQRFQGVSAERWQLDGVSTSIGHLANIPVAGSTISLTLPGRSITLLVMAGATTPDAPIIGTATPGETSAVISFTPPANNGGSSITGYTATCNPGAVSGSGAASPVTVHGLTNGVAYNCSVAAMNAVGTGPSSSTVGVTPAVPPGAASALIATATSTSQVSLTWTAGAGAVNYEIYRFDGVAYTPLNPSLATTYNDDGLAPNTTYLYRVRAMNGGGATPFSEVDAATTIIFTDDPLTAETPIKAIHMMQLRIAVNAMRFAAGLAEMPFTDPGLAAGTVIKALHVSDLRTGLDAARASIGLPALVYTDPAITAGSTTARTAHAAELRSGVK